MYDVWKSDEVIVPMKLENRMVIISRMDSAEERTSSLIETVEGNVACTQGPVEASVPSTKTQLDRLRKKAEDNKELRFTELLHFATDEMFLESYKTLRPSAAAGVDGVTWAEYGKENLNEKLKALREKVFAGTYRALPTRRTYIPKQNGKLRPLGIDALEDKIVQNVVRKILDCIYEPIFEGFSYGFRSGRGCHMALDALYVCITEKKVNFVLDADIKGYFDSIPHDKLVSIVDRRVGDPRIKRLICSWLKAGVLEEGKLNINNRGTVQGAVISPLLANIYLHYVLDLWVKEWRAVRGRGEIYIVRYADDFIVCFQYRDIAVRFSRLLGERLRKYGLELQTDKTRLIKFGRFAASDNRASGKKPPETFDFLGFTHYCALTRQGKFRLGRKTVGKRIRKKLVELKAKIYKMVPDSIYVTLIKLNEILGGYYNYFAVHDNLRSLTGLRYALLGYLFRAINTRSQRSSLTWEKFIKEIAPNVITPHVVHEYPDVRFRRRYAPQSH